MIPRLEVKNSEYGFKRQHVFITSINKTKANFWLNLALITILLFTITSAFSNIHLHKWLGVGMAVAICIHLVLNWRWIQAIGKQILKKMPFQLWFKVILNILILTTFLLLTLSGVVISLIYAPDVSHFHKLCFSVFVGLVLSHLALNWKWIASNVKHRLLKTKFNAFEKGNLSNETTKKVK